MFERFWKQWKKSEEPKGLCSLGTDPLTLHQCYEGILGTGGVGSGKTTSWFADIARGLLNAEAGGVVLTAKLDEAERWLNYAKQTRRSGDVRLIQPGSGYCCDPLLVEMTASGGTVESAAQMLDPILEMSNRSAGGSERFWQDYTQRTTRMIIRALWLAKEPVTLPNCYRFFTGAPKSTRQMGDPRWKEKNFHFECMMKANDRQDVTDAEVRLAVDFWLNEWPTLNSRTKSCIHSMVLSVFDKFVAEPVRSLIDGPQNIHPSDPQKGKLLIINMPVLQWREMGQFFQCMWKISFTRETLRRPVDGDIRPVFLWADEAALFAMPQVDYVTQAVARQSKMICVNILQNLPGLFSALGGGSRAQHEAMGWIANHVTKLIFSNSCSVTNDIWSKVLGTSVHRMTTTNVPRGDFDYIGNMTGTRRSQASVSQAEQWMPDVKPVDFTTLMKGGADNDFNVECYAFQGGRKFSNGKTWVRAKTKQIF